MFADDNSKFEENGGKFPERVEKIVGKGEISRYMQVLLFPQGFQKILDSSKIKIKCFQTAILN